MLTDSILQEITMELKLKNDRALDSSELIFDSKKLIALGRLYHTLVIRLNSYFLILLLLMSRWIRNGLYVKYGIFVQPTCPFLWSTLLQLPK